MTEAEQLRVLRTSSVVKHLLEQGFDFSPLQAAGSSPFFKTGEGISCELIGKDASGGQFALCKSNELSSRALLYVSSEGQAGIIGKNLTEGLSMMVAIPHWMDCLKFSGAGQLEEMRRALPFCEAEALDDMPDLESRRQALRTQLALSILSDPVQSLHIAVSQLSPQFPVLAQDGSHFTGLFNKFTVQSNPVWRRKLAGSK